MNAVCDAVSVHQPKVLIHAQRYDANLPRGVSQSRNTQYACPSAVGMLLQSSPKDTTTHRLQMVTRHSPQRMLIGPPLVKPLARSWKQKARVSICRSFLRLLWHCSRQLECSPPAGGLGRGCRLCSPARRSTMSPTHRMPVPEYSRYQTFE